jgi:oligopeptide transport system substrate-binding protein
VLRTLLIIVLAPPVALLVWLALGPAAQRADFVLTCNEPRTLDPQRVSWLDEIQLASAMFEGLTRLNAETFQPEPAVASRWDVSADRLAYIFHLRPEARWSTGDAVTAEDFRFAWLRVLDPKSEAQYAHLLFVIRGAECYYRSRLDDDPANDVSAAEVGVRVPDPQTLEVTLAGPCTYFLDLTSFVTFSPNHRPTLERWAYRDGHVQRRTQHLWTRPQHIVCNGAFVLTRWDFKQSLWLRQNPYYWDAASIGVQTIEAWITGDPNAALIAYETGRVDLVRGLERSVAERLARAQQAGVRQDFHLVGRFATYFYRLNCRRPPLDNADVRKALFLAIDREALCQHVLRLGEQPAYTYVPRPALRLMPRTSPTGETVYYQPPGGLGADLSLEDRVTLAREYLRRSGFERIAASRPIEIAFPPEPEQRLLAEAIQAMWESALGIPVVLRSLEGKVLSTRIRDLDYDVARSDWFGDYLDPSTFLGMFTTDSGQNRTGWSDAEYDRLIAAAAAEPDDARRFALFRAAEQVLCEEELPIIPIFFRRGNYVLRPRFEGLHDNVRDLLQIHRARVAR